MRVNRWTWIIFCVGTTLGSLLFTCGTGPDASAILTLPNAAKITKLQDQTLGGEVWFDLPDSKSPEAWVQQIGLANRFDIVNPDKWAILDPGTSLGQTAYVEYVGGHYHAFRSISVGHDETIPGTK